MRRDQKFKWHDALHDALTSLGYSGKEADRSIEETIKNLGDEGAEMELSELLRIALSNVRNRR
jgi:Holliday junction resolvasome RuvABC DNA-binding subunit